MDTVQQFRVLAGLRPPLPALAESRLNLTEEELSQLYEEAGLPPGCKIEKKPGAEYWYVKRNGKTAGVISPHKGGTYDADTQPDGKGKFQKGFKTPIEAARWILSQSGKSESTELSEAVFKYEPDGAPTYKGRRIISPADADAFGTWKKLADFLKKTNNVVPSSVKRATAPTSPDYFSGVRFEGSEAVARHVAQAGYDVWMLYLEKLGATHKEFMAFYASPKWVALKPRNVKVKMGAASVAPHIKAILPKYQRAVLAKLPPESEPEAAPAPAAQPEPKEKPAPAPKEPPRTKPTEVKSPAKPKARLLGKGEVRAGMIFGSYVVTKATATRVTVQSRGVGKDLGRKLTGTYTYVWDGVGYARQGGYLHTDGIHELAGWRKRVKGEVYPVGAIIRSDLKHYTIAGRGQALTGDRIEYPVKTRQTKGTITIGTDTGVWYKTASGKDHLLSNIRVLVPEGAVADPVIPAKPPPPKPKSTPADVSTKKPGAWYTFKRTSILPVGATVKIGRSKWKITGAPKIRSVGYHDYPVETSRRTKGTLEVEPKGIWYTTAAGKTRKVSGTATVMYLESVSEARRFRRGGVAARAAWMRRFEDELVRILGHRPPKIDWTAPGYHYTQGADPREVASQIATREYGAKPKAAGPAKYVYPAGLQQRIRKAVKDSKSYGMDADAALNIATFVVKEFGAGALSAPGAKEELARLVKKYY